MGKQSHAQITNSRRCISGGYAYSENFYGYSPGNFGCGDVLARYLALVFGSKFTLWLALITSGEFGFEREVVEKAALDRIPLPDFRTLTSDKLSEITRLFDGVRSSESTWADVDRWVAELYGLSPADLQIISDTLAYNLPFAETKMAAQTRPDSKTTAGFCTLLQNELEPWAKRFDVPLSVRMISDRPTSPWLGIMLHRGGNGPDPGVEQDWEGLLAVADSTAATELMVEDRDGTLLIGRLAQNRYWSETQAHLLARHIIWSRVDFFRGLSRG